MWHSPESDPLDVYERASIYQIQCFVGAVKVCGACGQVKPVDQFGRYGRKSCLDCAGWGDDHSGQTQAAAA